MAGAVQAAGEKPLLRVLRRGHLAGGRGHRLLQRGRGARWYGLKNPQQFIGV